jgi:hypothetical protein
VTFEIPSDEEAFAQVHSGFPNPDDYEWRVGRADRDGVTTVTVTGERVRAYLHHRSLDVTAHEHFTRPESDTDFYGSSTFTP